LKEKYLRQRLPGSENSQARAAYRKIAAHGHGSCEYCKFYPQYGVFVMVDCIHHLSGIGECQLEDIEKLIAAELLTTTKINNNQYRIDIPQMEIK
jgi:hypothetical protein